jgi:N-acetyl-anhydromuramyl-L-alanine amidase AmpD
MPAPAMAKTSIESTPKGWMPEATKVAVPASNFSAGNSGRKAAVLHITEGSALSAVSWFKNTASGVSAHFIVSNVGQIFQCVSVLDTAYANGLTWNPVKKCWIDPEKNALTGIHQPPWQGLSPPTNPNWQTISIEREGYYREQPSDAENAAVVRILQYVHSQFPTLLPAWAFMQTLIGHCHISPVARANCPGPNVNYAALASAANAPTIPATKRYRVKRTMISQRQAGGPPYAGELQPGEEVVADMWYTDNGGTIHLADGRGFVLLSELEQI